MITNYANDTTPNVVINNTRKVVKNLTNITQKLFTWFGGTRWKQILVKTQTSANIQIANTTKESSSSKKLLGIVIDNKLKLEQHIANIGK